MPSRLLTHPGGGSEEFSSVQGAGHDQLMDNSWAGWHQGIVSSQPSGSISLGSMVSSFHLQGSASCKNNLGMCVRPLSISFRKRSSLILLCHRIIV